MQLGITRKSDLAVRALCRLNDQARVKGLELAEAVGTSPGFLAQVVAPLVHAGWVGSEPGPSGGYQLLVPLDGLSMLDVIEAIEGPTDDGRCVLDGGPCPSEKTCALHEAWIPARDALLARLDATSVTVAAGGSVARSQ